MTKPDSRMALLAKRAKAIAELTRLHKLPGDIPKRPTCVLPSEVMTDDSKPLPVSMRRTRRED